MIVRLPTLHAGLSDGTEIARERVGKKISLIVEEFLERKYISTARTRGKITRKVRTDGIGKNEYGQNAQKTNGEHECFFRKFPCHAQLR